MLGSGIKSKKKWVSLSHAKVSNESAVVCGFVFSSLLSTLFCNAIGSNNVAVLNLD